MVRTLTKYLLELDFMDKSSWAPGEWHSEPDKLHWIDNETTYPCLIVRGPAGALNGYVGVPIYHPAYGLSYDGETKADHDAHHEAFIKAMRNRDVTKPILSQIDFDKLPKKPVVPGIGEKIRNIRVHGGLTFADPTQEPTKELWERAKASIGHRVREAIEFPQGDSAEWIKKWMPIIHDYGKWAKAISSEAVKSSMSDEVDETWWFGFDCAHASDLCPASEAVLKSIGHQPIKRPEGFEDVYRNIEYVEKECESLAKQLKALE